MPLEGALWIKIKASPPLSRNFKHDFFLLRSIEFHLFVTNVLVSDTKKENKLLKMHLRYFFLKVCCQQTTLFGQS